jgi:NAD(P)-dependent dehydrogenase (short-subunit alcohol dehydrogenase family)
VAKLSGKVALISGGTSGMGAAIAKLFQLEGADVIVTGSNPERLEVARRELPGLEVAVCDAADLKAINALVSDVVAKHGRIDVLVVNAGIAPPAPIDQVDEAFFDKTFDVNTRGAFFLMKEVSQVMPDGGAIVLTSSIAHAMGLPHQSIYSASKAALRSLGRTFAGELASRNIRVNTISPGPIVTPIWSKLTGMSAEQIKGMQAKIAANVPLRRVGVPEDIAAAALFLAADATFTTGADLPVDGGLLDLGNVTFMS